MFNGLLWSPESEQALLWCSQHSGGDKIADFQVRSVILIGSILKKSILLSIQIYKIRCAAYVQEKYSSEFSERMQEFTIKSWNQLSRKEASLKYVQFSFPDLSKLHNAFLFV